MYIVASWTCEITEILTQRSTEYASFCKDNNNLTSPTSNQMPYTHIVVSVIYDTLKKIFFEHSCSYCLILHFNCEMKLSVLI